MIRNNHKFVVSVQVHMTNVHRFAVGVPNPGVKIQIICSIQAREFDQQKKPVRVIAEAQTAATDVTVSLGEDFAFHSAVVGHPKEYGYEGPLPYNEFRDRIVEFVRFRSSLLSQVKRGSVEGLTIMDQWAFYCEFDPSTLDEPQPRRPYESH